MPKVINQNIQDNRFILTELKSNWVSHTTRGIKPRHILLLHASSPVLCLLCLLTRINIYSIVRVWVYFTGEARQISAVNIVLKSVGESGLKFTQPFFNALLFIN